MPETYSLAKWLGMMISSPTYGIEQASCVDFQLVAVVVSTGQLFFAVMFLAVLLFAAWMARDSNQCLKSIRERRKTGDEKELEKINWEDLFQKARSTVKSTIAALPGDLKAEAETLPCIMKKWPPAGPSGRAMGHYLGFQRGRRSDYNGPIVLYLGAIHRYCEERSLDFAKEVQTTYLHEFGHHLGWSENELTERGLM